MIIYRYLTLIIILGCLLLGVQKEVFGVWMFRGIELIGTQKSKLEIEANIPFVLGSECNLFTYDRALLQKLAKELKEKFNFKKVLCDFVAYDKGDVFLVIDVIEEENKCSRTFLSSIPWLAPELPLLHEKLYNQILDMFKNNTVTEENWHNDYLDFSNTTLHEMVQQLIHIVPPFREHLINIIKYDKDGKKRAMAANLLNWTKANFEDTVNKIVDCLDDPELEVRNNISRFIFYTVKELQSSSLRHKLIDNLLLQLTRASHADRNKALYGLLFIAQSSQKSASL